MSTCKLCSQELVIELFPEDFDEATSSSVGVAQSAPDDLMLLSCSCHFHWQCLLDESPQISTSGSCPSCSTPILTNTPTTPQILTNYQNEGGIQPSLNILPLILEEAYLDSHPTYRPARALMTMCAEGDVTGIVELLKAVEEDRDEDDLSPGELLRYRDELEGGKSGLIVALEREQQEVVWLLLWLASELPEGVFPDEVLGAARGLEAERGLGGRGVDIRGLRDGEGRRGEDVARGMSPVWAGLVNSGVLSV